MNSNEIVKVYFFPPTSSFNPYIDNIVEGLEKNGVEIVNKNASSKYEKLLSSFAAMHQKTQIYHFNWIENKSSEDTIKAHIICRLIFAWLSLMKKSGGKLAWTMHNKESHFCKGKKDFHYAFMEKFISMMDMILVHAGETKQLLIDEYHYPEEKICFVPHGSYLHSDIMVPPRTTQHDKFAILAFGMVNRYKNIPLLIRAFKELNMQNAELFICGKCDANDSELKTIIDSALIGCPNITYDDRFIPDEEIDKIFSKCDVVILPYDKQSMINSGAAIKAFSEGKPIIVSRFGAIKDIENREFIYSYDYISDQEHLNNLKNAMLNVYKIWCDSPQTIIEQGQQAFYYAKDELSWINICANISEFYQSIVRKK